MALLEPFTDLIKAFREAIGLIDDIDRQFDKVRAKLDKRNRRKIAAAFATLHFDVGHIPLLLENVAKARKQPNGAVEAKNQPDANKIEQTERARDNATNAIMVRINSTADEVNAAFRQLAQTSQYIIGELGLEFSDQWYRVAKEDLRYRLVQYARALERAELSEEQIAKDAQEIALTIERFNASVRSLHDKILGKTSGASSILHLKRRALKATRRY
ncbi:hypothetical protein [Rhizobium leguminosarum]|uniref:hypothetical protein n=1 Tax=Rhizobium leguminosarum TaxID=384 RepID=UPI0014422CA8|nr:hypothetical protein [Rhizobium leguminosarum]MBY5868853.1 hypothetical protein [Rhizobium leguminosarum]NKM06280.1 hypothetical protein [Rhizobium leguminosarum bv. viciae]